MAGFGTIAKIHDGLRILSAYFGRF